MNHKALSGAFKKYTERHPGMVSIIGRIVCYGILLSTSLFISEGIFHDGHMMTLSMFLLLASTFELLWHNPASAQYEQCVRDIRHYCDGCPTSKILLHNEKTQQAILTARWRLMFYISCVMGIGLTGFILAKEAHTVHTRNNQSTQNKRN